MNNSLLLFNLVILTFSRMCDTNELDPENWPVSDDLDESAGGIGVGRLIYLLAKVFF